MNTRNILLCAVATLLLGSLVGVPSVRSATDSPPQSPDEIRKAQLKLIHEVQELCKAQLSRPPQPGAGGFGVSATLPETLVLWSRREVEVRSELGNAADRIAALEDHKDRMESLADRLRQLHETGRTGRMTVIEAEYQVLQAELWLAEARTTN